MGPRDLPKRSCRLLPLIGAPFWAHLGLILGHLGPPWPFLGGPGGHLEAGLGLGRLELGVQSGNGLRYTKLLKNLRKTNGFCRFLGASCLQKGCKLVVWRSCCGLEALPRATWMPSWLQDWLGRAKLAEVGPKMGPRGLQKLSCRIFPLIAAPFWGARRARAHAYAHIGRRLGIAPR